MARQNRVSNGSRPRMGNLGRVKAVTSNRERTLWLSQSGLLFCTSFSLGLHSQQISVFSADVFYLLDFKMNFDSEDSQIYYIAEDME